MELHPTSWKHALILLYHLRLRLPSGLFPWGFPTKTLYTPLVSIHATCPTNLIILDFMTRITGEQYRSSSSLLCSFLHSPVTSSLLGLWGLHAKTLYAPLLSPIRVTRPAHLTLPDLIARIMFAVTESTRCKLQSIHISSTVTSSVLQRAPNSTFPHSQSLPGINIWQQLCTGALTDRPTQHRHLPAKTKQSIIICHKLRVACTPTVN
jgi:hypothetical protein